MNNWLNGLVATTAFKYLLSMVASWVAIKLHVEEGSVAGLLSQGVALIVAAWGVWEASRSKVVVNGEKVIIPTEAKPKAKTLIDLIKSRT